MLSFLTLFISSFIVDIDAKQLMKNDAIEKTIFSTILQIHKKSNRTDIDSIYKQIIQTINFEDVTKEFLGIRFYLCNVKGLHKSFSFKGLIS